MVFRAVLCLCVLGGIQEALGQRSKATPPPEAPRAAAPEAGVVSCPEEKDTVEDVPEKLDVAIVGGGIAGTYAAWRLRSSGHVADAEKMWLFERSDRIGGRFNSPSIGCDREGDDKHLPRCELGGMRIRSNDTLMLGVAKELGIELGPFHMNDVKSASDKLTNPVWLRTKSLTRRAAARLQNDGKFLDQTLDAGNANNGRSTFQGDLPYVGPPDDARTIIPEDEECRFDESSSGPLNPCFGLKTRESDPTPIIRNPCSDRNVKFMERKVGPMNAPVYDYSVWSYALAATNGSIDEQLELNDALSGYRGTIGSGAATNLGVADVALSNMPSPVPEARQNLYYQRPLLGMETLPKSLWRSYTCKYKGRTTTNAELLQVTRTKSHTHPWRLLFRRTFTSPCSGITGMANEKPCHSCQLEFFVRAKRVVLALPKAALSRVQFNTEANAARESDNIQRTVTDLLATIVGAPLMKTFLAFKEPWWMQYVPLGGIEAFTVGRYTTSLAVNQLFAWYPGTQQENDKPQPCQKVSVLQMYVTDSNHVSGWGGLMSPALLADCKVTNAAECSKCFNETSGFFGKPANHITVAFKDVMQRMFSHMFSSLPKVPEPFEIKYMLWDANNLQTRSDAVHYYTAGVRWWEVYKEVLQPFTNLHIVGEAFSFEWGWGEGALETTEHLLHEIMGLDLPSWLSQDDFCWSMPYYTGRRTKNAENDAETKFLQRERVQPVEAGNASVYMQWIPVVVAAAVVLSLVRGIAAHRRWRSSKEPMWSLVPNAQHISTEREESDADADSSMLVK